LVTVNQLKTMIRLKVRLITGELSSSRCNQPGEL
jgi:hypothetical protein